MYNNAVRLSYSMAMGETIKMNIKGVLMKMDIFFTGYLLSRIETILYGVDFSRPEGIDGIYKRDEIHYQASMVSIVRKAIKELKPDSNDAIIDVGCGKGKMVWFFRRNGFGRSDGIEFSKTIAECGQQNLKKLGLDSIIYNEDATSFENYEDYNYFYFYNPFVGEIFRSTVRKILESTKNKEIIFIYLNPLCHDILENEFRMVLVKKYSNFYRKISGREIYIYGSNGHEI